MCFMEISFYSNQFYTMFFNINQIHVSKMLLTFLQIRRIVLFICTYGFSSKLLNDIFSPDSHHFFGRLFNRVISCTN